MDWFLSELLMHCASPFHGDRVPIKGAIFIHFHSILQLCIIWILLRTCRIAFSLLNSPITLNRQYSIKGRYRNNWHRHRHIKYTYILTS